MPAKKVFVRVPMTPCEKVALIKFADDNLRDERDEAHRIIRDELLAAGYLVPVPGNPILERETIGDDDMDETQDDTRTEGGE